MMHFSIPETVELTDKSGSTYIAYKIHANGSFHCQLRYRQLHSFHEQLKRVFGTSALPSFPPKKFLPMNGVQIEDRRVQLEKFIQIISQNARISRSEVFNSFFLSSQLETAAKVNKIDLLVTLDIYLPDSDKKNKSKSKLSPEKKVVTLKVKSNEATGQVVEQVLKNLDIPEKLVSYFSLFVQEQDDDDQVSKVIRRLQNFESPFLTLATLNGCSNSLQSSKSISSKYQVVLRTSYWDSNYDRDLFSCPPALDMLYHQVVADVNHGFIPVSKEVRHQLKTFQIYGQKKSYLELSKTLQYYSYQHFTNCTCNHPTSGTSVTVSIGGKEIVMRTSSTPEVEHYVFRVTRIRCWRLTTSTIDSSIKNGHNGHKSSSIGHGGDTLATELSFEYLMNTNDLKWITITSCEAILMSMCLQGMVEELIAKRKGAHGVLNGVTNGHSMVTNNGTNHDESKHDQVRNGASSETMTTSDFQPPARNGHSIDSNCVQYNAKRGSVKKHNSRTILENDAFDGIGDDDL